jgi:hypothetical protein
MYGDCQGQSLEDSKSRTIGIGDPEKNSHDRASGTGERGQVRTDNVTVRKKSWGQEYWNRTTRTGQLLQESQHRTTRKNNRNRVARIEKRQNSQNMKVWTRHLG